MLKRRRKKRSKTLHNQLKTKLCYDSNLSLVCERDSSWFAKVVKTASVKGMSISVIRRYDAELGSYSET